MNMRYLTSALASVKGSNFSSLRKAWFQPICRQQRVPSLLHVSTSPLDKRAFCNEGYKHSLRVTSASWVFDLVPFLAVCGHSYI